MKFSNHLVLLCDTEYLLFLQWSITLRKSTFWHQKKFYLNAHCLMYALCARMFTTTIRASTLHGTRISRPLQFWVCSSSFLKSADNPQQVRPTHCGRQYKTRLDITHIVHNLNNKIYQYWFIANLRAESWCDKTPAKMLHPVTKLCRYFVHFLPFVCDSEGHITSSSKQGSSWGGMSKVAMITRGQGYSGLPKSFLEL